MGFEPINDGFANRCLGPRGYAASVLRYFENLPLGQIADAMDTTYKAVEHLLARARELLQGHLEKWGRPWILV